MVEEDDSRSPQRGERVDSMNYYTSQLVSLNETMEEMQREEIKEAMEGNTSTPWLSQMIETASDAATSRLVSVFWQVWVVIIWLGSHLCLVIDALVWLTMKCIVVVLSPCFFGGLCTTHRRCCRKETLTRTK